MKRCFFDRGLQQSPSLQHLSASSVEACVHVTDLLRPWERLRSSLRITGLYVSPRSCDVQQH